MNNGKKFLIFLVIIILVTGGTITSALWNGNQQPATPVAGEDASASTLAIGKVTAAGLLGTSITLQEKDINSILSIYFNKGVNKGNVTVKGLELSLGENNLSFKMPFEYKGYNLMLSSGGKCTYLKDENKIEFQPSFYKIGVLPVPKKLAETLLAKNNLKGVEIKDSIIKISAALIPVPIENISFKNKSIILVLKKLDPFSSITKTKPSKINPVPSQNSADNKNNAATKSSSDTKTSIAKVDNQLAVAASTLQSSKEKDVLDKIRKTMSSMSANPAYNYTSDVKQVKAIYTTLSNEGKSRIKLALLSNVDVATAIKLKSTFGL